MNVWNNVLDTAGSPSPICEDCQQGNHMHLVWNDFTKPPKERLQAEFIIPKGVRVEVVQKVVEGSSPELSYLDLHMTWLEGFGPDAS